MGLTGNDGVVGVALFLGGDTTTNRAVVLVTGGAFRMKAKLLKQEFARGGALQRSLLRYTQALITQISQTPECNRLHAVEKRLCRWMLLCHDRVKADELLMTQEFISNVLGGRRESVTVAAGHLQDAGLIRYTQGHIRILDRSRPLGCCASARPERRPKRSAGGTGSRARLLKMESDVRWARGVGGTPAEGDGRREPAP
jgi:Crp-like helix-turn-helix domain